MTFSALFYGLCVVCTDPVGLDPKVTEIVEQTRTTSATYSLYSWNTVISPDGKSKGAFSAEFHKGALHRVETEVARIVADCSMMTGSALFLGSGEIVRGEEVAKAACGINTATPIIGSKLVGTVETKFGPATRVAIKDAQNLRLYDVSTDGILVNAAYATLDDRPEVLNAPIGVKRKLPEVDIFSEQSLSRIVTPAAFRTRPD